MGITLRPHQIGAADAVEDAFRQGVKRPLIDACVAAGKSLMFAELARREVARGGRALICAHVRELVQQNAEACRLLSPEIPVGINAAALNQNEWRGPIISASIQSVYKDGRSFGPITLLEVDEAHLVPHAESGMYHELERALGIDEGLCRLVGASGTVFRLQGGSLVEGEGAPFEKVVYSYSILDGIREGYLCPAFSIGATDTIDTSKLKTRQGEFTAESSDDQMIAAMDNHIAQMVAHGADRKAWLVFEAGTKAAKAMAQRMNEWRIPTGLVLGTTKAVERMRLIEMFRTGQLRALVNVNALTTGFDVPQVDLLVGRRPTQSLGLYIQMTGRLLRTIGGNIEASIAAGKADGAYLDFAGNIERHGPLDFIRPKEKTLKLVSCDSCGKRNPQAARNCWACDAMMMKLCPACIGEVPKGTLDCPLCGFDMRAEITDAERVTKLLATPSGAALIATYSTGKERLGGWIPVWRVWRKDQTESIVLAGIGDATARHSLFDKLAEYADRVHSIRLDSTGAVDAILIPNGRQRITAVQMSRDGNSLVVPMPLEADSVVNQVFGDTLASNKPARRLASRLQKKIDKGKTTIEAQIGPAK